VIGRVYEQLLERPWIALLLGLVLLATLFVLGQPDFVASDPLWYASVAHGINTDPASVFNVSDHHPFVMRVGLTLPLALLYRVFGVSTLVSDLPAIISALAIVCVVYAACSTPRAKLIAVLVSITCVPLLRHGTVLNVDLPSAALMATSVLCLARRGRPRGRKWLVAAAFAWFAAFLVKETALWCAPVWLYVVASDVRRAGWRSTLTSFAPAIGIGTVLGIGYLIVCTYVWGSPLARFSGVQELTYEHAWALSEKSGGAWLARLTWLVPLLLVSMFPVLLVPSIASPFLVTPRDRIWVVATGTFLALYWFGSASTRTYSPLPLSPRMVLPLLPGMLVVTALASDVLLDRFARARLRPLITIVVALALVVPATRIMFGMVSRDRPETTAFAHVRAVAARGTPLIVVCGEPRCVAIANFYFGLVIPPHVSVVFAGDFATAPRVPAAKVIAVVNTLRATGARPTHQDLTPVIDSLGLPAIYRHRYMRVYDAHDGNQLRRALQQRP
jgi:4-amino-4-deoxy-L-arabinose transferase-like glycosyltransferase